MMDSKSSTSSDSELESKIKLRYKNKEDPIKILNFKNCVFCQQEKNLVISQQISKEKFITCAKIRWNVCKGEDRKLSHIFENFNELKNGEIFWHKNCYKSFTSTTNITAYTLKHKNVNTTSHHNIGEKRNLRTPFDIKKCVFCQKRLHNHKLSQVMTKNMEAKIKKIASHSPRVYNRIGENDLIALEIKYHSACLTLKLRNINNKSSSASSTINAGKKRKLNDNAALQQLFMEIEKGLNCGKGYTTSSVCKRYKELERNVDISDRVLINAVSEHFANRVELINPCRANEPRIFMKKVDKEDYVETILNKTETVEAKVFTGTSELQILHNICQSIKNEIQLIPSFTDFKNLKVHDYKDQIPNTLYQLISILVCNDSSETDKKEVSILSICQDIIFALCNGKNFTPKHIGLGVLIHQETRSKKLVEALNACGHSISYVDTLRVRNSIAQEEIHLYLENDQVVIPRQLVPNRFVQFSADNIDILEETLDKTPTFHGTQMAAFQRGPVNEFTPGKFQFLPYKAKLSIPNEFNSLQRAHYEKSKKFVHPTVTNANIVLEKGQQLTYDIKYQNIAWVMCRMADTESENMTIPQWSGFHKLLFENNSHVTSYGYLPILPHVSSDYDTVWTVMMRCREIAMKLGNKHTVITFDQAIYYKAKELQWHQPELTKHLIIRLGGFHIIMNFLKVIGQFMTNSGLSDVWQESGLYGQSTIDGILDGKKYNKAIRAHKLTYESLMRILMSAFNKWLVECNSSSVHSLNLIHLFYTEIRNRIRSHESALPSFLKVSDIVKDLFEQFPEFIESQSTTVKYWYSYIELIEILLEFQYSERSGNWQLHLNSFRKMLPWFFALNHTNYSRWGTIYLLDMYELPNKAPEVYEEFINGNFVVKRLEGNFNQLSVDQALEHINKTSKDAGGIVGLTKNSTKLDEWFLSYNVVGMILDEFRSSLDIRYVAHSQNIESGTKRMAVDEESVQKLHNEFSRFQILSKSEDQLVVISTNEIASPAAKHFLLNARQIGEDALKNFLSAVDTPNFFKPLKKLNVHTFQRIEKLSITESKKSFHKGQDLLQKLLAAKEMGRDIKYDDIFKFELTPYPMALAPNGVIATPTHKSDLGNIIESFTSCEKEISTEIHRTCHIFDGMALVQSLGKPSGAKTFRDYFNIIRSIVFKNTYNAERIDFVLDYYKEFSIKNCTRVKRGLKETINRTIESPETLLPQQWNLFVHSIFNKMQLTNFLSKSLYEYSLSSEIKFVTSGGFFDILRCEANHDLDKSLLSSSHEEADTRIILHILQAKSEGYTRCIVDCKDTDVFVLLAHFKDLLTNEIWLRVGTKENRRFIPVHNLKMNSCLKKSLPAFHALTGCDTTSQFTGLGKKTCWKTFLDHHKLLEKVGVEKEMSDEVFNDVVKFVIKMYTTSKDVYSINSLRGILASSKPINKLPPTLDSLQQHCLRAHYQTRIWINSGIPRQEAILPDLASSGWTITPNGRIEAKLTTLPILPANMSPLTTCNCKKGCTGSLCSCKRKKICCIGSCKCMAQVTCVNKHEKKDVLFTENDSNESSSDSE